MMPPPRTPWFKTPKGMRTLIGSAAGVVVVIVAIVLVVTLVVTPNQRAAQAAASASAASASASAQAAQDYQDAVTAFNNAAGACTSANGRLATAIKTAQSTAKTDPSTLQDPTLIDKLNQAITNAQTVTACAAPTMASDIATIEEQTTQLGTDTQTVTTAASTLAAAGQAVPASVQAKQQAAAQAQASASAAAEAKTTQLVNSLSYTEADWNGYKATTTLNCTNWVKGSDTASVQTAWQNAGGSGAVPIQIGNYPSSLGGSSFDVNDTSTGIYAFCTLTVTNASPGYHLNQWKSSMGPSVEIGKSEPYSRTNSCGMSVSFSNGTKYFSFDEQWDINMTITGDTWGPVPVTIFVGDIFTPNTPQGNPTWNPLPLFIQGIHDNSPSLNIGYSWI